MHDSSDHKRVFRSFALPVATFDYLKNFQREYQAKHQVLITNNQALVLLLSQHKQMNVESEAHVQSVQHQSS